MPRSQAEGCRHDRAPLRRLGKVTHKQSGRPVFVLLCTACGFTVTTEQIRRLRRDGAADVESHAGGQSPGYYANLTG